MIQDGQYLLNQIKEIFDGESAYKSYQRAIVDGTSSFKITQKYLSKEFDHDWIDIIEDCLPSLDTIVRNPRRFITVEEDIIDISLAKQISVESVKHLAQHTQFISDVDVKKGTVTPSKILNTSKEESFEVYENRFIYTLIKKLYEFVQKRFELIKKSFINNKNEISVLVNTNYKYQGSNVKVKFEATTEIPFDENKVSQSEDYLTIERVKKINQIIEGFLSSPFAREMRNSAPVRPPIMRTNVIKKEPNFKKALILWQFIESYEKTGFEAKEVNESNTMSEDLNEQYNELLYVNDMILSGLSRFQSGEVSIDELSEKLTDEVNKGEGSSSEEEGSNDEFPMIKLELKEVRKVYYRSKNDKYFNSLEYREITSCLDRVITQQKINVEKKDEEERRKLIEKQKKEEKRVREKNIADRKREELRRKKEEELAVSLIKKEEREKIRQEKIKALEQEKIIKERKKQMMEKLLEEQHLEETIEEYRKSLLEKMNKELDKERNQEDNLVQIDLLNQKIDDQNEIEEFKNQQVELFKKKLEESLASFSDDYEKTSV